MKTGGRAVQRRLRLFFPAMGLLLLAIVVAGFGLELVRLGRVPGPLLIAHGLAQLLWYMLLVSQPVLVAQRNLQLHRTVGYLSLAVAAAIVISGYLVTHHAYLRPGWTIGGLSAAASTMFPLTDMINFSLMFAIGFLLRASPAAHKRAMLLAGLLMIEPAAARLVVNLGGVLPVAIALEFLLFLAIAGHDLRQMRRIHWVTLLGVGLFLLALAAKLLVANTAGWAVVAERLFG